MILLTTPHRQHRYELDQRRQCLQRILTMHEVPFIQNRSWFAFRKATGERLDLGSSLLANDDIVVREPTAEDWKTYRETLPEQPRPYTAEEAQERFLDHMWAMIDYWDKESSASTARDKMSGLMHSMFAALDGCTLGMPGFRIMPDPHESDAEFHRERGQNWYPSDIDIGGMHELMHRRDPQRKG